MEKRIVNDSLDNKEAPHKTEEHDTENNYTESPEPDLFSSLLNTHLCNGKQEFQ